MDLVEIDAAIGGVKVRWDHGDAPYDPDVLGVIRAAEAMRAMLPAGADGVTLIGPLTAAEWGSFRLGTEDDLLYCCGDTSDVRDAIFHVLRMGAEQDDGIALRGVWHIVEAHEGLGEHPLMRKLYDFYVAGQPPVSSDALLAEFLAPNPDFSRALIEAAPEAWDLGDPDEKVRALGRMAGKIHAVKDAAQRAGYIESIAGMLGMPVDQVRLVFDAFRGHSNLPVGSQESAAAPG